MSTQNNLNKSRVKTQYFKYESNSKQQFDVQRSMQRESSSICVEDKVRFRNTDKREQSQNLYRSNDWRPAFSLKHVKNMSVFFCDFHSYFANVLQKNFQKYDDLTVVGCMAWLSDPFLINCLKKYAQNVFILVNDENFSNWGSGKTHLLYDILPWCVVPLSQLFGHLNDVFLDLDCNYAPVRCIPQYRNKLTNNRKEFAQSSRFVKSSSFMHSKYLIMMGRKKIVNNDFVGKNQLNSVNKKIDYIGVWMGSVNFTRNSKNNIETAIYVEDRNLAEIYFTDFSNLFVISTPIHVGINTHDDHTDQEKRLMSRTSDHKKKNDGSIDSEYVFGDCGNKIRREHYEMVYCNYKKRWILKEKCEEKVRMNK